MLVKTIVIFLAAMALIGMIGKVLFPNSMPRLTRNRCKNCGKPRVGKGDCKCRGRA